MTTSLTRRRFLCISAASAGAAAAGGATAARAETGPARWRGVALGAACGIELVGVDHATANRLFAEVEAELTRLEGIFSLYREGSEIRRLNASGSLTSPAPDLLRVLATCDQLHTATNGAFDPTVQPLFQAVTRGHDLGQAATRDLVGWDHVRFDSGSVQLGRQGAALTLNGIAQGYITDRVADLLRARGLTDVMVDMGEISALGRAANGKAWRAGIAAPSGQLLRRLTLTDRALATSAPMGTILDPAQRTGHIFDPVSGGPASAVSVIAVSASRAELADGLSTALCVLPKSDHDTTVARFPNTRVELCL